MGNIAWEPWNAIGRDALWPDGKVEPWPPGSFKDFILQTVDWEQQVTLVFKRSRRQQVHPTGTGAGAGAGGDAGSGKYPDGRALVRTLEI